MDARNACAALAAVALLAGCGSGSSSSGGPAPACLQPAAIEHALAAAPGDVHLADGTRLSLCVRRAGAASDLEDVATAFINASDAIVHSLGANPSGPVELGFLIGATRRGALASQGIDASFVTRMEQTVPVGGLAGAAGAALDRGLRAGQAHG